MENYIGFLFLFPINKKYNHVIQKYFTSLFTKEITITEEQFKNIFALDPRHPKHHIAQKAKQNLGDGKMILHLIVAKNTEHINEYLKKLGRRTMDNLRYEETGVYRTKVPLQNSFHTTDDMDQLTKALAYFKEQNILKEDDITLIQHHVSNRNVNNFNFPNYDQELEEAKKKDQIYKSRR